MLPAEPVLMKRAEDASKPPMPPQGLASGQPGNVAVVRCWGPWVGVVACPGPSSCPQTVCVGVALCAERAARTGLGTSRDCDVVAVSDQLTTSSRLNSATPGTWHSLLGRAKGKRESRRVGGSLSVFSQLQTSLRPPTRDDSFFPQLGFFFASIAPPGGIRNCDPPPSLPQDLTNPEKQLDASNASLGLFSPHQATSICPIGCRTHSARGSCFCWRPGPESFQSFPEPGRTANGRACTLRARLAVDPAESETSADTFLCWDSISGLLADNDGDLGDAGKTVPGPM